MISAFDNLLVYLHRHALEQGWATYGPRAGSGPPNKIIRPAALLQILVIELCGLA